MTGPIRRELDKLNLPKQFDLNKAEAILRNTVIEKVDGKKDVYNVHARFKTKDEKEEWLTLRFTNVDIEGVIRGVQHMRVLAASLSNSQFDGFFCEKTKYKFFDSNRAGGKQVMYHHVPGKKGWQLVTLDSSWRTLWTINPSPGLAGKGSSIAPFAFHGDAPVTGLKAFAPDSKISQLMGTAVPQAASFMGVTTQDKFIEHSVELYRELFKSKKFDPKKLLQARDDISDLLATREASVEALAVKQEALDKMPKGPEEEQLRKEVAEMRHTLRIENARKITESQPPKGEDEKEVGELFDEQKITLGLAEEATSQQEQDLFAFVIERRNQLVAIIKAKSPQYKPMGPGYTRILAEIVKSIVDKDLAKAQELVDDHQQLYNALVVSAIKDLATDEIKQAGLWEYPISLQSTAIKDRVIRLWDSLSKHLE